MGVGRAFTVITRSRLGRTASATAAWLTSTSTPTPVTWSMGIPRVPPPTNRPTTTVPTTTVPETTCQRTIERARPCARRTPSQTSITARPIAARASSCSSGAAAAYSGPRTSSTGRATTSSAAAAAPSSAIERTSAERAYRARRSASKTPSTVSVCARLFGTRLRTAAIIQAM